MLKLASESDGQLLPFTDISYQIQTITTIIFPRFWAPEASVADKMIADGWTASVIITSLLQPLI